MMTRIFSGIFSSIKEEKYNYKQNVPMYAYYIFKITIFASKICYNLNIQRKIKIKTA